MGLPIDVTNISLLLHQNSLSIHGIVASFLCYPFNIISQANGQVCDFFMILPVKLCMRTFSAVICIVNKNSQYTIWFSCPESKSALSYFTDNTSDINAFQNMGTKSTSTKYCYVIFEVYIFMYSPQKIEKAQVYMY